MKLVARIPGREKQLPPKTSAPEDSSLSRDLQTVALEISEEEGAFFLFSYDAAGNMMGDTWHQTLEGAMHQAQSQFAVSAGAWTREDEQG
ncbi:hypothetical protein [Cystobacter fuscus]|uniref:hypothetical protein n=1 Tax=Cystobacter fuscus TaxID=43 RepID=UPI0012FD015C|nr:hypothetical protein [Cystobacter fuscus]